MVLPNFIGIGATRSGTTWLDKILRSHPDIYLPDRRKEINFFDWYYERGIEWYQEFFPVEPSEYKAIGEITPNYIYVPRVPGKIKETVPNCKFIVNLRNPADRAYSNYGFLVRDYATDVSFQECIEQKPELFLRGLYSEQIQRYLELFPIENFCFLVYENIVKDPEVALHQVGQFLDVDASKFDRSVISKRVNFSGQTRFPRARAAVRQFRDFLRKRDLDWLWETAKTLHLDRLFESNKPLPKLDPLVRSELLEKYKEDIAQLEKLIGVDLSIWK